jgi:hypothetical protein
MQCLKMQRRSQTWLGLLLFLCLNGCSVWEKSADAVAAAVEDTPSAPLADVTAVIFTGATGAYTFSVTVASPDTGCKLYADWWEILDEDGALLYRRVLLHSHVNEQPFTRNGGPVAITADQTVWIRAHMHPQGYGGATFKGSVQEGFAIADAPPDFAAAVATQAPLPLDCAF